MNMPIKGEPSPEGPFEIMINEYQRKLIERALHFVETNPMMQTILKHEEGCDYKNNKWDELQCLRVMFQELPQTNTHGTTHGFCL